MLPDVVQARPRLQLGGAPAAQVGERVHALAATDALLLAWLALEGPTSRERLGALLWPDSSAEAARNALRQRLFRLRRQTGVDLVDGQGLLRLADDVVHDLGHDGGVLGDLQAGDSPELDTWLAGRRAQRQAQTRQSLETRIEALEAAGDIAAALPLAQALLQADPLSEDAHRRLMRLHYLRGDRAAALLAFDRCEAMLKHEVGARPAPATLELLATIDSATAPEAAPGRRPVPAAVLRPPRLIGRDAELAALHGGLDAGHVVVLLGEAGLGKSRLLQALAGARAGVLHVSGRPGDQLAPYATLARTLRQLLDLQPQAADLALRGALAPLLPELGDAAAAAQQASLAAPVLEVLRRAAPGLQALALDDLHFADDATVELLQRLLATPRDEAGPVRWCLGLRPPAAGSRQHALLEALARAGPHTRLALQPLTEAQLAALVDSLSLPGIDGAATAARLHQRCGGNPLFALETLKLAWSDGSLALADGLPRPQSLAQLIGQQLARLTPAALQLARAAAVAGVDFSIALAQSLLQRSVLDLADPWAELEAQHVLHGEAFAHDLIHDAVLQGLPEVIARHLHAQTAAWLEAHAGEPARVAAHWEAAGQRSRALPALRAAAERAHRALRESERIAFLLQAADIAESTGRAESRDEAFELVQAAVAGHMSTVRQADGLPLLARLARLARTPLQQARVAADRAWYAAVLGDLGTALAVGEQALQLALPLGDAALSATLHQRLGTALVMAGRFDEALPHMQQAQPWMQSQASVAERCEFAGNLAVVLDNLGQPEQAQVHHLRAIADAAAAHEYAQHATLLGNHALNRLEVGDLALAATQLQQAQRIVSTYELAGSSAGFIAALRAQCERTLGRYDQALHWCAHAQAIVAERNPARLPAVHLQQAQVWLDLGQHARALALLDGAALQAARALPPRLAVRWLLLLARVKRRLGRGGAAEAMRLLAEAAERAPANGWPELALAVRTEQALALPAPHRLDTLLELAAQASARALHAVELGALLLAADGAAADDGGRARQAAHSALALAGQVEAGHVDRALRWLAPARALAGGSVAEAAQAAAHAQQGQAWLRDTAQRHVAPEWVDSFLHQHPANHALRVWTAEASRRGTPA